MGADIHLEECSLASNEASLGRCWLEIWKQNASMKCSPKAQMAAGKKGKVKDRWTSKSKRTVWAEIPDLRPGEPQTELRL